MPEFTQDQIQAMMKLLDQTRYVVRQACNVYQDSTLEGYVVVDTAHQDEVMSGVLALEAAKGWAYGELESWARRALARVFDEAARRRGGGREFPNGTPGYDEAERDHP